MEKETNDRKQTMMDMTGLREKPLKDKKSNMEQEQPYHMTSIGTSGTGTFSQKIAKRLNSSMSQGQVSDIFTNITKVN